MSCCWFKRPLPSAVEHRLQKVHGDDGKYVLFIRMTWLVNIRASCWRCWMKRTLNRSLGLLPSGKVTLTLLTLGESSGIFVLDVQRYNLFSRLVLQILGGGSFLCFPTSSAHSLPRWHWTFYRTKISNSSHNHVSTLVHNVQLDCNLKSMYTFIRVLKYMHYMISCEVPWIAFGQLLYFVPIIQKNACISK